MRVLFLKPRLDVTFKQGFVPEQRGPIPPIREHWKRFAEMCEVLLSTSNAVTKYDSVEMPLWQITPEFAMSYKPDVVFVPHREDHNFELPPHVAVYYYMQMVLPWLFQIDKKGWCGGASVYPIAPDYDNPIALFNKMKEELIVKNVSKFDQPPVRNLVLPDQFIFFPCQIPHDQTIQYHSKVSVVEALKDALKFGRSIDVPVIVKGHPVNPGSMVELRDVFVSNRRAEDEWYDNASIHELLSKCAAMFTVNSGTGIEAVLHEKPIYTYGKAEYDHVAHRVTNEYPGVQWSKRYQKVFSYPGFFNAWYKSMMDTNKIIADQSDRLKNANPVLFNVDISKQL